MKLESTDSAAGAWKFGSSGVNVAMVMEAVKAGTVHIWTADRVCTICRFHFQIAIFIMSKLGTHRFGSE